MTNLTVTTTTTTINTSQLLIIIPILIVILILAVLLAIWLIKRYDKRSWSFHPIISITSGTIISFIIFVFVFNLIPPGIPNSFFQQITTIESLSSLVVGGFIATYFAKKNKIQYGIYVGVTWLVLYGLVSSLISDLPISLSDLINSILLYIGFILAPTIGSYLAILVAKHLK